MRHSKKWHAGSWGAWVILCLVCSGCGSTHAPDDSGADDSGADDSGAPSADVSAGNVPAKSTDESRGAPDGSFAPISVLPFTVSSSNVTLADTLASKQDARADNWESEVANSNVASQLKRLEELIRTSAEGKPLQSHDLVSSRFVGTSLRPQQFVTMNLAEGIAVRNGMDPNNGSSKEYRGLDGFADLVSDLVTPLLPAVVQHIKFKLVRVDIAESSVSTRMIYQASFRSDDRSVQQSAEWTCEWKRSGDLDSLLQLTELHATGHEETECTNSSGVLFTDCTESVLGANASYQQQVVPGIPHWSSRISRQFISHFGHQGIAIGDVNGDGLDDLYVCDTGGLPNRLFIQNPDGTATERSAESGVDFLEDSLGALLLDLDNDGDQDLVVSINPNPVVQIAENDGTGVFTLKQGYVADTDAYSLCAADYDQDRDLDIYVCGYNARRPDAISGGLPFPLPYDDANNGGRNFLLRNDGNLQFTDATVETGLDQDNRRFSLAASWEDFDNDGDPDLYVANDFGRNCLYRNDKGVFTNVAAAAGVEDQASGMSVSWGDFDRDGWMDLYVSNMFSAAGNRVTYQRKFSDGLSEGAVRNLRRMARGNTLFRNHRDGTFRDVSESARVTLGRWAWSSRFADLNNDGWQDLVVANGYVTNDDNDDL
ncbi:VCBS repeat-containing protein [Pirellulales bacterium]|nr:VCBS repeat-containing protein [Pirellulales bacterium]